MMSGILKYSGLPKAVCHVLESAESAKSSLVGISPCHDAPYSKASQLAYPR